MLWMDTKEPDKFKEKFLLSNRLAGRNFQKMKPDRLNTKKDRLNIKLSIIC